MTMYELTVVIFADALESFRVLLRLVLVGAWVLVLVEISLLLAYWIGLRSEGGGAGG